MSLSRVLALLPASLLFAACAMTSRAPPSVDTPVMVVPAAGERIATRVLDFIGAPYRYGGNGPDAFDCSGLVRYVFAEMGVALPRTSEAQFAATQPVAREALLPGDLLFFRIPEAHIGIFVGDGRFVHAPSSGRAVGVARLDEPWFTRAFVGGGRVAFPSPAGASLSPSAGAAPAPSVNALPVPAPVAAPASAP
jgi:hypothetical protein